MLTKVMLKECLDYYKTENKIITIDDVAKLITICKILDNRNTKYNIIGLKFEELVYNELMDLKMTPCVTFLDLIEYSLFFSQVKDNPNIVANIYQALKFMVESMKTTSNQRKNCRYKKVIEIILQFEEEFYGETLKDIRVEEKEKFIKNDIINYAGEILFNLEYYRLTNVKESNESKEYWTALVRLARTIDKYCLYKNIERNDEIEDKIRIKTLMYLTNRNN